jgi:hypothetical protein
MLCGVNFRYFQQRHECLSDWKQDELKYLANWISKAAERTVPQITSTTKTCHAHLGKPPKPLPSMVSPEMQLYGIDITAKARVHGFFTENTFYLVWLDRAHEMYA